MILNVADISKYSPISTISESEYHFEDSSRKSKTVTSIPFLSIKIISDQETAKIFLTGKSDL